MLPSICRFKSNSLRSFRPHLPQRYAYLLWVIVSANPSDLNVDIHFMICLQANKLAGATRLGFITKQHPLTLILGMVTVGALALATKLCVDPRSTRWRVYGMFARPLGPNTKSSRSASTNIITTLLNSGSGRRDALCGPPDDQTHTFTFTFLLYYIFPQTADANVQRPEVRNRAFINA